MSRLKAAERANASASNLSRSRETAVVGPITSSEPEPRTIRAATARESGSAVSVLP